MNESKRRADTRRKTWGEIAYLLPMLIILCLFLFGLLWGFGG